MAVRTAALRDQMNGPAVVVESSATQDQRASIALCILVAFTPLAFAAPLFEPYVTPKEVLLQAGTATIALLWIFSARKTWTLALTRAWLPLSGLVVMGAASIIWSSNRPASIGEAQRLLTCLLLFLVTLQVMRQRESRALLVTALMFAGSLEAVYVLWQYGFGDPIFPGGNLSGKWRTFGTLGNPNWTGEFLAIAALTTTGRLGDLQRQITRSWPYRLTLAALVVMLVALAATLARGAWLAFIVGGAAFLWRRYDFGDARRVLRSLLKPVLFAMIAIVLLVGLPVLKNGEAWGHLRNLKSARGRIWMWLVTFTMIQDRPLRGHGLGTFATQFPPHQARLWSRAWSAPFVTNASFTGYAHNDYLQLWSESGVLALLALGALIWMVIRRARALTADSMVLGCWAALISILVNSAFAFPLHLPASLMLFTVLLAVVEATVTHRRMNLAKNARLLIMLVILIICFLAYRSSYHQLVADAQLSWADAALQARQWREAEASINAAIYHAPTYIDGHAMLGRLYFQRGEYDAAVRAFDQAKNLAFDVDVYEWRAMALEKAGRRREAIATLQELTWLRPDLIEARQKLNALLITDSHRENQP